MAARKIVKRPAKTSLTYVHEFNSKGQHRIVAVGGDCANVGEWVSYNQIAVLDSWRAATDTYKGVLPQGIFSCSAKGHVTY